VFLKVRWIKKKSKKEELKKMAKSLSGKKEEIDCSENRSEFRKN
jgi:hypothetical protein